MKAITPSTKPKRPKTGGRKKGTPNKSTSAIREAVLGVFADLQEEAGSPNGHFLGWARASPTDFYRLASKLLPLQVTGQDGGPVVTRVEIVGVTPEERAVS